MPTSKRSKRDINKRSYWLRLGSFFLVALIFALLFLPTAMGGLFIAGLMYLPCTNGGFDPADYLDTWEDVTIEASIGGEFDAYFIPGENGATIIIPPTLSARREGRLRQAAILNEAGYAVLMYESRRCAGLGPLGLGYHEVSEVSDALDYLLEERQVDAERIGIFGYSSAGATSVMAAAELPEIDAVIAEGGYDDFIKNGLTITEDSGLERYFFGLYRVGMAWTYRAIIGDGLEVLSPISVIDDIAPRPIFLIYGSAENNGPGHRQLEAAGSNAELWIVPGAEHGTYFNAATEEYPRRLVEFFDRTLLGK